VESGTAAEILTAPAHPYTQALLNAVPRLGGSGNRLQTVPGMVPPPGEYPTGCRFAPRCSRCQPQCTAAEPEFITISPGHDVGCMEIEQ
jgi:oligopeptide/dipeptide ABC transporter ATP-binding protein